MSDPTDDKTYEGMKLSDFIRHMAPQLDNSMKEVEKINQKGYLPLLDQNIPEIGFQGNRADRRRAQKERKKAAERDKQQIKEKERQKRIAKK